jgi:hypothetical protein
MMLAGRDGLIAELDARLADGPAPRLVALCGLGGTGKTSVAVEYAHRHSAEVGVCWQFAAEDPAVLVAEFAVLAAQLGVRDVVDARDPVASVHAVLARSQAGWLLIFDNVTDRASVEAFIPPTGSGRVLITTQSQHWPPGQALDVPVLDIEVGADFLVARTGDADRGSARELAAALGGLPLALEQAAAYIQATATTMGRYLALFRDRRADLLARGEAAGHPADVAATLGLALSRLAGKAPAAAELLCLLAFLAPEPAPLSLLFASGQVGGLQDLAVTGIRPLLDDPVAAGDAIVALRCYSLVAPAGGGLVLVHRLVQAVTRARLTAYTTAQWQGAAAALVEAAVPADPVASAAWPAFEVLLPHVRAVLDLTSVGMGRIAEYLGCSGSYLAARDLCRLIADARTTEDAYGPEHPATLAAGHNLAYWTGAAGDAVGARDQLAVLLPIRERVLGPNDPDSLNTRHELAYWSGRAGDAAGARDQLAALLPIRERVLGPDHPGILATRHELAHWTGEAGDAAGACHQLAALSPVNERIFGPDHHSTLFTRHAHAYWTGMAGDAAEARDQLAVLLPVRERVLGSDHPLTLATRHELAYWTGEAGDAVSARDRFASLLPIRERVLGSDHPYTLVTRHGLARWTGEAGDAADARDQFAALLPTYERVQGPDHPDTLNARHELARWTVEAGDVAGARDQYAALLPVHERVFGLNHLVTLNARNNLAHCIGIAGDAAGARDQYAALAPVRERVQGPDHPETLTARHNLARWTGDAGDAAGARDQLAALLPIRERVLGADHPHTLATRYEFIYWIGRAGDAAGARSQFAALLPIRERILGSDHPDTLATRYNLARWTGEAGDAASARDQLTALLPVIERVLGPDHPRTLTARTNLALWAEKVED